jgi:hypothetical protein
MLTSTLDGLDVAVDDPLLMRVLNRVADAREQLEPLADRELLRVAEAGNWIALDQLHHEVRASGLGRAGVEDLGDAGWSIIASA